MYQLRLLKLLTRHCPILNQLGHTALVAAATEGHAEVVKLLLDAKIAVNRANKVSITEILGELTLNDIDMLYIAIFTMIFIYSISDSTPSDYESGWHNSYSGSCSHRSYGSGFNADRC